MGISNEIREKEKAEDESQESSNPELTTQEAAIDVENAEKETGAEEEIIDIDKVSNTNHKTLLCNANCDDCNSQVTITILYFYFLLIFDQTSSNEPFNHKCVHAYRRIHH